MPSMVKWDFWKNGEVKEIMVACRQLRVVCLGKRT